jgi:glycerophosphoryl diester phosphodiesterase
MSTAIHHGLVFWIVWAMASPLFGQLIVAHRGASYDAPENTLPAFTLAIEQGADALETDFYLTTDQHVICFHDKDTERITGRKLLITETPFEELRKMDVGSWKGPQWKDERMPTIEEVLAAVPEGKLTDFKKQDDGTLKPTADEVIATLKRCRADALDGKAMPEHFDAAFIQKMRDAGFAEFHVWTVDDPEVARFYRDLGVTSITTNRPGWLREQLEHPTGR